MNIIVYVFDALRPDYLGCYGFDKNTSPNIDRFAENNEIFLNAYSTSTWTKPAASSLLTGQHPREVGILNQLDVLPEAVKTLPEKFQAAGFTTYAITANAFISSEFGFDRFDELCVLQKDQTIQSKRKSIDAFNEQQSKVMSETGIDNLTIVPSDDINDVLFPILESNSGNKFVLVWSTDTHGPYYLRDGKSKFGNKPNEQLLVSDVDKNNLDKAKSIYCDMIRYNDQTFGELLDKLKSTGEFEESFIAALSDHGEAFGDHEDVLGRPITGHNALTYEEVIKIPLIIKPPDSRGSAKVHDELVQVTDILPTAAEFCDVDIDESSITGSSVLPSGPSERLVFAESQLRENDIYSGTVRDKNYKLIKVSNKLTITKRWKRLIKGTLYKLQVPSIQVYDLDNDPEEQRNLSSELDHKREALLKQYEKFATSEKTADHFEKDTGDISEVRENLEDLGYLNE